MECRHSPHNYAPLGGVPCMPGSCSQFLRMVASAGVGRASIYATLLAITPLFGCAQPSVDTSFVATDHQPSYIGRRPKALFDEGHNELHTLDAGYAPFAKLLGADGLVVEASVDVTPLLGDSSIRLLIVANPRGQGSNRSGTAFNAAEISSIEKWVKSGGSLLLVADHMPFAGAVHDLASAFGVTYHNGFVGISDSLWPPNVFRTSNTTLVQGCFEKGYAIDSAATYTGSAFDLPPGACPVLTFEEGERMRFPTVPWQFTLLDSTMALTHSVQGGVFGHGKGRVACFGEAAAFTAQVVDDGATKVGLNDPEYGQGNRHLLLNVIHYLIPLTNDEQVELDRRAILDVYNAMDDAFERNDMRAIAHFYGDSASVIGSGFRIHGKENIADYWDQLTDRGKRWDHEVESLVIDGDHAYQQGRSKLEYLVGEESRLSDVRYTVVWQRGTDARWRIIVDHYTPFTR